ncbi:MAG: peptidylprolyl isomerase [Chitinophagaceae bacterium]
MNRIILLGLTLLFFSGKLIAQELRTVYTMDDAKKFIENNPGLNPEIITISTADTSALAKAILKRRKGEFFSIAKFSYKVIDEKEDTRWRVSYIFLDKFKVDKNELEKIKKAVTDALIAGSTMASLSDTYTMDHNTTKGDTGFFGEDMMTPEFVAAVKIRKPGEVFFVDIPERDWYYIIQKTHEDQKVKEMTLLRTKK